MMLSGVPKGVLNKVDKIGRQFLWKKSGNVGGLRYVAWKDFMQAQLFWWTGVPLDDGLAGYALSSTGMGVPSKARYAVV